MRGKAHMTALKQAEPPAEEQADVKTQNPPSAGEAMAGSPHDTKPRQQHRAAVQASESKSPPVPAAWGDALDPLPPAPSRSARLAASSSPV